MKKNILSIAALICLSLYATAGEKPSLSTQTSDLKNSKDTGIRSNMPPLEPRLPLNELRVFAEAFNRISRAYVEEIDDKTLLENAIKGMLSQMDPHSAYLDKNSFEELQESTRGNYGGLGLEIGMVDGFVKVISPMDDTPAHRAGIESGDLIIQIDDTPVKSIGLSDAVEAMRGKPGTEVVITVLKNDNPTPEPLTLVREVIKITSVKQRYLEKNFGYLRIAQFQSDTGNEVSKAIIQLKDEGDLEGLVIDLRNNPGGVLQAAVSVSDIFLDKGLIVYTQGRMKDSEVRYHAQSPDSIPGVPLVILVNEGTASASEIVAGALQDRGRAIIMGTPTFGKGSVQTLLPLSDDKAIKLTTARYYTPNGSSIQASGITPDIEIVRSKVTPVKSKPWRIKEKNLPKHLRKEKTETTGRTDTKDDNSKNGSSRASKSESFNIQLAAKDYQLNEALILLKGLKIIQQTQ
jgi:carboxyl-terminal processing protease